MWIAVVAVVAVFLLLILIGGSGYCMAAPTSSLHNLRAEFVTKPNGTADRKAMAPKKKSPAALQAAKANDQAKKGVPAGFAQRLMQSSLNKDSGVPKANF